MGSAPRLCQFNCSRNRRRPAPPGRLEHTSRARQDFTCRAAVSLTPPRVQSGFSLTELMVASTVGLLLLSTVVALFVSSKRAYVETERHGFLADNGRHALDILAEDLRLVDFWGAARAVDVAPHAALDAVSDDCSAAAAGFLTSTALFAKTADAATVFDCVTDAAVGSEVLVVKHVATTPTAAADLRADQTYLAANLADALLFDGADTPPSLAVGGDIPNGAYWEYRASIYYVSDTPTVPTLFRKQLIGGVWSASEEIAAGVERLVVTYGVDTNGDAAADQYVSSTGADWSKVVSLKFYLLLRSEQADSRYVDANTYQLGPVTFDPTPNDGFRRAVFDTTVTLRNRQLLLAGGL